MVNNYFKRQMLIRKLKSVQDVEAWKAAGHGRSGAGEASESPDASSPPDDDPSEDNDTSEVNARSANPCSRKIARSENWLPMDEFTEVAGIGVDCKFELKGAARPLVNNLLSMLRAPWMDTTENVIIRINEFLLNLKILVDWRNPGLSATLLVIISATTLLSIWVPFSQFLLYINGFLFMYWTWVWDYICRLGLGPIFMLFKYFKVSFVVTTNTK